MGALIDRTGNVYGRLKVISRAENKNRRTRWNCVCECGNTAVVCGYHLNNGSTRSCGCLSRDIHTRPGSANANWKGGRQVCAGYVKVCIGRGSPMADKHGYVREHRLVMAEHLGRPLENDEVVHHKNGIRDDNRIENLELCLVATHHPAQSVSDMVAHAKALLRRYEPGALVRKAEYESR